MVFRSLTLAWWINGRKLFLYFDEADLSYRVKKAGYIMVCVPTARVYHVLSHSFSGKTNPIVLYYSTRNELLFARKHLNILIFFTLWMFRFIFRIIQYTAKTRNYNVANSMVRGFTDFLRGKYGEATFQGVISVAHQTKHR